ncbi:MAG: PDDEXK nuclease domain-containing protein [Methanoregula sp.]|jgi:predicted nuclease of restriction endonuclease-like (RecB) superfamily|uniref:PDDEXK nuclease domain-containing protein n=1 Tax=Methanoregula sp. TaxID=2052170 RepID=UPI003C29F6E7
MSGKAVKAKSPTPDEPILPLVQEIRDLVRSARRAAAQNVNTLQVVTNFEIGRRIVEYEQKGLRRAGYGERVLKELSLRLTREIGRGFSERNLKYIRRFYLEYRETVPQIAQTLSAQLPAKATTETPIGQTLSAQFTPAFTLSWSHYLFLMTIDNRDERRFYEIESRQNQWSLSELKRQFNSGIYERLALSRDKKGVKALADKGQIIGNPQDVLKDPYVLEFLGLDENTHYSESDLESAIIDKLETFLLELGKGFLFEARQKRFTFDADHYFVDLVFYNRLLRCYVLIDLKIGKITHENLGQMQMYVHYYDREVKLPDENPTVGIILCRTKNDALVRLTLPEKSNIYASQYQLYLPSKEELKQKLIEWSETVPDTPEAA